MIATLTGMIGELAGDKVILEVGGVGYGVLVTRSDQGILSREEPVKLYIYEHIKEDAHDLLGFSSLDSKQLFEQLLSVKNVGPKGAMAVLDTGTSSQVRSAIASGDVKFLQTAKGVGKRAAEQMVVELRDKMGAPVGEAAEQLIGRSGVNQSDEAVQALISLGYSDVDAQAALVNIDPELSTEQRLKLALKA